MYCCSGYQITPDQGGARPNSSFEALILSDFSKSIRANFEKVSLKLFQGFALI